MKFSLLCLLTLCANILLAQVHYFDRYLRPVPAEEAYYYRKTEAGYDHTMVRMYYKENDQLASEGLCSALHPRMIKEGSHKTYYRNGQLQSQGEFREGREVGVWKYYHENGRQSGEENFTGEEHLYIQRWDESGTPLLTNGTGIFFVQHSEMGSMYFDIVDHKTRSAFGIAKESGDTVYTVVEKTAEYRGGMPGLYKHLGKIIRYPATAKRYGIEGKVFVEFTIEKNGAISNANVLRGIGGGCDEEAMRALQSAKEWKPGTVNGKPVRQKMVLPISFRLG